MLQFLIEEALVLRLDLEKQLERRQAEQAKPIARSRERLARVLEHSQREAAGAVH